MTRPRLPWLRSGAAPAEEFPGPLHVGGPDDPLAAFLRWYGEHGPAWPMTPAAGLFFTGGLPGVTLYSSGPYQVQLFIFPAGTSVPRHRHPNIDTIEMHVAGDFDFRVENERGELVPSIPLDHLHDRAGPVSRWWGRGVRVRPGDWHALEVGPAGAAFLSVQRWLKGEPTTVGLDWEGAPVNERHGADLCPG